MPKPIYATDDRETIVLHAPWWSDTHDKRTGPTLVLERRKKIAADPQADVAPDDAADEEEEWVETEWPHAPLEHATLYRQWLHSDSVWVQSKVKPFSVKSGGKIKTNEGEQARTRTLGYVRRVVEMTDGTGKKCDITEDMFLHLPEEETLYLQAAINILDDSTAPILHEDYAKAEQAAATNVSLAARGFPAEEIDVEAYAAGEAQDRLFRSAGGVVLRERQEG